MQQVVVISGGSRGLGEALVADFLASDCAVATFSRSPTPFLEQCADRYARHDSFVWQAVDAGSEAALKGFVKTVAKKFGRIDALINNASVVREAPLALMRPDDIRQMVGINLEGTLQLTRLCVRVMLRQSAGTVINVSSVTGTRGFRGIAAYSATKAGLDGMTRALARELGPRGIRVNSVAPGFFESEMTHGMSDEQRDQIIRRTPAKRLGRPQDILGAVRFLLSEQAHFITGQTIVVDGGLTC